MNKNEQTVVFRNVNSDNDNCFEEAMRIYNNSFPANERQLPVTIKQRIETGKATMIIGLIQENVAAVILLFQLHSNHFLLLDYLAVKNVYRNAGVGSACMQFVKEYVRKENKTLILETEDPRFGNNKKERVARINFYTRNGACILQDVPFVMPALWGASATNMLLMMVNYNQQVAIKKDIVQQLITTIYREVYGRKNGDELLLTFINKVPEVVGLICNYV